uniref:BTB domain-containing protein n=1 Tax=Parastrongyloides trichosuri TaxID=131310 RepID=A0A0N5A1F1_PARTI
MDLSDYKNIQISSADEFHASCRMFETSTLRYVHKYIFKQFLGRRKFYFPNDILEIGLLNSTDGKYKIRFHAIPNGGGPVEYFFMLRCYVEVCPKDAIKAKYTIFVESSDGNKKSIGASEDVVKIPKTQGTIILSLKIEEIEENLETYLNNGDLALVIDIEMFKDISLTVLPVNQIYDMNSDIEAEKKIKCELDLCDSMSKLLVNDKLADFSIIANGETYRVHKAILASRCTYFATLFSNENCEECITNKVEFKDFENETLEEVLQFIYTAKVSEKSVPLELLKAADRLQMDSLKIYVGNLPFFGISLLTVCDVLFYADMYHAEELKMRCVNFISEHKSTIIPSKDWSDLERKNPFLTSQTLKTIFIKK